jgi:hypothetical protein
MSDLMVDNEVMNAFRKLIPYLSIFFDNEASFAISDTEKYLFNEPCATLPLKTDPGTPIPKGGAAYTAINTGEVQISKVPKEVFGVPFRAYAVPVRENGNVVGCILVGKSLKKSFELQNAYRNQSTALEQITRAIGALSSDLQNVLAMNDDILKNTVEAEEDTKVTDQILSLIKHISARTNLLGINATIEAARAGEAGKGFHVVAQEIQKLSNTTNESLKKVETILKKIKESIGEVTEKVNNAAQAYQSQSASIEEISASLEELAASSKVLEEMADKM